MFSKKPRQVWTAGVVTLFPGSFPGTLGMSICGKALDRGIWALKTLDIRDFAVDRHKTVDSSPYGGGPGMVLRPDVLDRTLEAISDVPGRRICLSPRGRRFDQAFAKELAHEPGVVLVCGRYEGIDQRVIEAREMEEVSLGDFVLTGGEIAAQALLDATVRLLPGVIGSEQGLDEESFEDGLLEYPQYTHPKIWKGRSVPEVLLSGNHKKIAEWKKQQSELVTRNYRPDLWEAYEGVKVQI
ncbi:MAG: tRNA (guanosine(37)-N1)-methyltransferase TrmD [Rhodobacteraceae bacterium]|jgi:tRNA (guanine37-N1)-methyltransferase|nr:tRNA (guanosine(37)-N1)-methyltransferase TrmD [Paracoccaceae bacterium]MAP50249.1 tRNA (guanosine(37)-N1)-methyltransferase TrmD [Rhodospirillaceae bacterium]|tara:strand:- start:237 stop:959 length:723 start_codon:yes stop_codon:yes gene_type:complete